MDQQQLRQALEETLSHPESAPIVSLVGDLGFFEPGKSATNLRLLHETFADAVLLSRIAETALGCADPDLALNALERLSQGLSTKELSEVLQDEVRGARLMKILGASPFLGGILCRKKIFFQDLFEAGEFDLRKDETRMLKELRERIANGADFTELQRGLRHYKAREILRIGSRDLCGEAALVEVTAELSALAAATLQRGYEISDALLRRQHGAPLLAETGQEAEFTIFGMGKFGGHELNFSSDIDLIYFYSSEKGTTAGVTDSAGNLKGRISLHQYFCKLGEMVGKSVGQATEDGFVFRVDLRLRPEGNNGDMANSLRSAEVYYESWGQSWERAAMLKARPVAGSLALGERLLKNLEPFIYRRYLDFGMIEDIKLMKQKIDHSLTREKEGELNLKLGQGGIREIEFFIQALQLINAGKKKQIRSKNSLCSLGLLRDEKLVTVQEHDTLKDAYIFLRTTEHRIQVEQERQTHNLPIKPEQLRCLARRCGFSGTEDFRQELDRHRKGVRAIFDNLFHTSEKEIKEEVRPEIAFMLDPAADSDLVKDMLQERGFPNPDNAYGSLVILREGVPHSHLTERARRQLERISPLLLQAVVDSPEPEMALRNLEHFLTALRRARGTFFALLAENREIIKVLVLLFGTSQFLSRIFISHPEILDVLVSRSYALAIKGKEGLSRDLDQLIAQSEDYETRLAMLRRFRNEEFLRIAMGDLHGLTRQGERTREISELADVCLAKAVEIARQELIPRFGLPFCISADGDRHEAAFAILGMGKLGGYELNYHSDLDIIFIYEGEGKNEPVESTDRNRFRELGNQEYFSRLAQRIISVLTLMTREGYVYQIDTRLRPSGNQGPLVTSLPAYERYHQTSAALWERQALTKARVITGPEELRHRIDAVNIRFAFEQPVPEGLSAEINRLRERMESEIAREGKDNFNIKTGKGGMVDVEFLVQYHQMLLGSSIPELRTGNTLKALKILHEKGILNAVQLSTLEGGYKFLRRLENTLRLVHDQSISDLSGKKTYLTRLARRLGYAERPLRPDQAFLEDYRSVTGNIRLVFNHFLDSKADTGEGV